MFNTRHYVGLYLGRNIGRVVNILHFYTNRGDELQYGDKHVLSGRFVHTTYEWYKDTDIPIFDFRNWEDSYAPHKDHIRGHVADIQDWFHPFLDSRFDKFYIDHDLLYLRQEKTPVADVLNLVDRHMNSARIHMSLWGGMTEEEIQKNAEALRAIVKENWPY